MTVHDVRMDLEECAIEPRNVQRKHRRTAPHYHVFCLSSEIWLRININDLSTLDVNSFSMQYRVRVISDVTAQTAALRWPHYESSIDLMAHHLELKDVFEVSEWPTLLNNIRRMIR